MAGFSRAGFEEELLLSARWLQKLKPVIDAVMPDHTSLGRHVQARNRKHYNIWKMLDGLKADTNARCRIVDDNAARLIACGEGNNSFFE